MQRRKGDERRESWESTQLRWAGLGWTEATADSPTGD